MAHHKFFWMESLRRAIEHVKQLELRIKELEQLCREKDAVLLRLANEIPAGERKVARLGLTSLTSPPTSGGSSNSLAAAKWPADKVRKTFIDYFVQQKQHTFVVSSPCIPVNDPTLLFANSGMNQFKPLFLGQADPTTDLAKLKRAANTQKCIRAGGKHNDLEDVGFDGYHHTFFEMLGNWSFGDYFKQDAINWAWELLTKVYQIDPSRLYVTYFEGNARVPVDTEAKEIWSKLLPANRILPFGAKENFWEMGPTGPCGPCTEIHYDRIGGRDAASMVNKDDPTVIEIWNNVFIQYNRTDSGELETLPSQHVDTGMGFERLVSVLQDKASNYDTDVWHPLFRALEERSHVHPYSAKYGADDVGRIDTAYRIVADHIRTLSHAIADGCVPSSEGRGYVLRRILRRAVRYGLDTLKCDKLFFSSLVPTYVATMGGVFPELKAKQDMIKEVIELEERDFGRTIEKGRAYFGQISKKILESGGKVIPGDDAFFMYSSMGFPLDLTEIMARELGMTVDQEGFQKAMQNDKALSAAAREEYIRKKSASSEGLVPKLEAAQTDAMEKMGIPVTLADVGKLSQDASPTTNGKLLAIYDPSTRSFVQETTASKVTYGFVLDRTNFYHESGGQVADVGSLSLSSGETFQVCDVQASKGYVVHAGIVKSGATFKVGQTLSCVVDGSRRLDLARGHTMTHVMNLALLKALARSLDQKGSLVAPEKLRFDFDSREPISVEQLRTVESICRDIISKAQPVYTAIVPLADAKKINSLRAVFGETYPDPVRVVSVGVPVEKLVKDPTNEEWKSYSVELCGGSHLNKTDEAKGFVIVQEEGIAKGIRRITAITGQPSLDAIKDSAAVEKLVADVEKTSDLEKEKKVREFIESLNISIVDKVSFRTRLDAVKAAEAKKEKEREKVAFDALFARLVASEPSDAEVLVFSESFSGPESKVLQKTVAELSKKRQASVFIVATPVPGQFSVFGYAADKHKAMLPVDAMFKGFATKFGAKGGGDAQKAMCSGPADKLQEVVQEIRAQVKAGLGANVKMNA